MIYLFWPWNSEKVIKQSLDLQTCFFCHSLEKINRSQLTSNITFLELVEVTLQLLEIISNVGPDINILRRWK